MSASTGQPSALGAAEYTSLRAEILHGDAKCRDILLYVSAAVGAILAFWFQHVADAGQSKPEPAAAQVVASHPGAGGQRNAVAGSGPVATATATCGPSQGTTEGAAPGCSISATAQPTPSVPPGPPAADGAAAPANPRGTARFLFAVVTVTLALCAVFVAGNFVASYRRSIWRISSYLSVFGERADGAAPVRWETRLSDVKHIEVSPETRACLDDAWGKLERAGAKRPPAVSIWRPIAAFQTYRARSRAIFEPSRIGADLPPSLPSGAATGESQRVFTTAGDIPGESTRAIESDARVLLFLTGICVFAILLFLVVYLSAIFLRGPSPSDWFDWLQLVLGLVLAVFHFYLAGCIRHWTAGTFRSLERFGEVHRDFMQKWLMLRAEERSGRARSQRPGMPFQGWTPPP